MKIIDAHVHVIHTLAGFGAKGELRSAGQGRAIWADGEIINMIPPELGETQVTPEKVIELMDRHGVEKAVLLQGGYYGFQNQYCWESVQKYPGRMVAAAAYDPFCMEVEAIRRHLFDDLGFPIVKFEVSTGSGLMSAHGPFALDCAVMQEVYEDAANRNLVFVIDIGKCGSPSWQVEALRRVILRWPGMRFVVCHILAPGKEHEEDMKAGLRRLNLPNVWFDIAALPSNTRPEEFPFPIAQKYMKLACGIAGSDRIMFGSDLPSTVCRMPYQQQVDMVLQDAGLSDSDKEKIMYNNAQSVYFSK